VIFAEQRKPLGTGDALLKSLPALRDYQGTVLVVNGDTPLMSPETLRRFLALHKRKRNKISLLSFVTNKPGSYGRVIRDEKHDVLRIVEERNATDTEKAVQEVNSGVYAMETGVLPLVREIKMDALKKEYYLTDIISIARKRGVKGAAFCAGTEDEFAGINTPEELEIAEQLMKKRMINHWKDKGVLFTDGYSVFISPQTEIGKGTRIYPGVHIEGATRIGQGCVIYPNVRITDSTIEAGAVVKDSTLIEGSTIRREASVGPFAHVRPGSEIGSHAKVGNFVELKKALIGSGTKASHLSYLGDAKIGRDVNIGAGTITCNYDGVSKHLTTIEDNVFIGSDSQLVAPVKIGKGAYVGAGSTITEDVPAHALALSRAAQKNVEGWAVRRQSKVKSKKVKVKGQKK
jgi:bifunctional UDP-N-acetylglucosamine pyrophosphorylase/glucosamine-1-phosphate N-acetyltransferase